MQPAQYDVVTIEPRSGISIDFRELWLYRDLFFFLVWRDIKGRYAQSILGIGWAVLQPLATMVVFTVVFGGLARIDSDGLPYAIFSYCALVPWTYFSGALSGATGSLVTYGGVFQKVYFPRLIMPLSAVLGKLVDFFISFSLLFVLMIYFEIMPTIWITALPLLILIMMATAAGMGMFLTALAVQYRDIKYAMSFGIQLLMYLAPVVYPTSKVPEQFREIYALNPMVGVIEGFRSALLGANPMPWELIGIGAVSAVIILIVGTSYFCFKERLFADVV